MVTERAEKLLAFCQSFKNYLEAQKQSPFIHESFEKANEIILANVIKSIEILTKEISLLKRNVGSDTEKLIIEKQNNLAYRFKPLLAFELAVLRLRMYALGYTEQPFINQYQQPPYAESLQSKMAIIVNLQQQLNDITKHCINPDRVILDPQTVNDMLEQAKRLATQISSSGAGADQKQYAHNVLQNLPTFEQQLINSNDNAMTAVTFDVLNRPEYRANRARL